MNTSGGMVAQSAPHSAAWVNGNDGALRYAIFFAFAIELICKRTFSGRLQTFINSR